MRLGVAVEEGAGGHGGFAGGLELVNDEGAGGAGKEELVIGGDEGDAWGGGGRRGRGGGERVSRRAGG